MCQIFAKTKLQHRPDGKEFYISYKFVFCKQSLSLCYFIKKLQSYNLELCKVSQSSLAISKVLWSKLVD